MKMDSITLDPGSKISPMMTEFINLKTQKEAIKVSGLTVCSMGQAFRNTKMAQFTKANFPKVKNMEKEN